MFMGRKPKGVRLPLLCRIVIAFLLGKSTAVRRGFHWPYFSQFVATIGEVSVDAFLKTPSISLILITIASLELKVSES
ncbi:hypothetical protein BJY04DRAFT_186717 [Aspergillus karnatakaensis]|uniref:uncharacterized protein n=1 Tax=Aspergillus karnatakaensis TaxID=1810916 RepID=UPI003CCE0E65